jgi:hypothetical protein
MGKTHLAAVLCMAVAAFASFGAALAAVPVSFIASAFMAAFVFSP